MNSKISTKLYLVNLKIMTRVCSVNLKIRTKCYAVLFTLPLNSFEAVWVMTFPRVVNFRIHRKL